MVDETDDKLEDVEIAEEPDQASAPSTFPASARSTTKNRLLLIASAVVVLLVLVIAVPTAIVKSRNRDDPAITDTLSSESAAGAGTSSSSTDTKHNSTTNSSSDASQSGLPAFGIDITRGYVSSHELETDIMYAGEFVLGQVVKRNLDYKGYGGVGFGRPNPNSFSRTGLPAPEMDTSGPQNGVTNTITGGGSDVADDLTDYGTNNQETNIEEGDLVVSDGNLLYTAYGDYVVAINPRTGVQVAKLKMPSIKTNGSQTYTGGAAVDIMPYWPQPAVRSLVVHEDSKRLLVVADGYASKSIQERAVPDDGNVTLPIIFEYLGTLLHVYDTDALASGDTVPLFTKNVHGSFNAVRVIEGVAHLMTISGVDTYTDLIQPFERYNFPNLSDEKYATRVERRSKAAISDFTEKLMDDLVVQDGSLPNLARISLYSDGSDAMAELTLPNGPMNSYAQIASFDMSGDSLDLSLAGTFIPDYWAQFYAAPNSLLIAGQGSRVSKSKDSNGNSVPTTVDTTYFLSFGINGTSVAPHSVGKVDGYLVNTYAIDIVGDLLRVAVTVRGNTWWWIMPVDGTVAVLIGDNGASAGDSSTSSSSNGGGRLRRLQNNGIAVGEPNPATPAPDDGSGNGDSSTENYLVVLQILGSSGAAAGEMIEQGRVKMGKPNESITTVRFFDNVAYAVTFEQTDPFYVIDLSNPGTPVIVGELEISGFSSFLLPINDDNTKMLAIGQEADVNGTVIGMQLTVFNITVLSDPRVLHRLVLENSKTMESWSDALWDFKATRYAGGRLIIPIDIYDWYNNGTDDVHGYIVFKADETGIEEECRINHGSDPMYVDMCYYCASLPRRSMIFDGDLVTLNGHFIASTDMQSCSANWETLVSAGNGTGSDGMGCCGRW